MITLIYLFCLVAGFLFMVVCAVLGHITGGHDADIGSGGHAEAGADTSDGVGVSAFSPTVIASFVTAFGGFGIIFHQFEWAQKSYISAPLSVACAFGVAFIVLSLLRKLFKETQSSSESKVGELVGKEATVITPIPENGVGEITYVHGGSRYNAPAREETGAAVPSGALVKISKIVGSQFYVKIQK
ncbi:MAG: NfeD family protein [Verrucomicrobiia bacterium]|jgi:membrane protein implicated in regulation of membrane protease activity